MGAGAFLRNQNEQRNRVRQLFQDGGDHERAEANRVGGDDEKGKLPDQRDADKAVAERGVGDGRRIIFADEIKNEVKRRDDEKAPYPRNAENDFCKFHKTDSNAEYGELAGCKAAGLAEYGAAKTSTPGTTRRLYFADPFSFRSS